MTIRIPAGREMRLDCMFVQRFEQGADRAPRRCPKSTPYRDSEGFDVPTVQELNVWRALAAALLTHDFTTADSLVGADLPEYELVEFLDTGFQNRTYFLLREKLPVSHGWGTYIVNPAHEPSLMVQVPHPRYDLDTYGEGADLFRRTGARFFLMAGTHRCANETTSPCSGTSSACGDGIYHVSDVAHYANAPFLAVHEVLDAGVRHLYVMQGRFTNGSTDPCVVPAVENDGFFIHVEQHREVREDPDEYGKLIDAVNQAIGTTTGIVDPPPGRPVPGSPSSGNAPSWPGRHVPPCVGKRSAFPGPG